MESSDRWYDTRLVITGTASTAAAWVFASARAENWLGDSYAADWDAAKNAPPGVVVEKDHEDGLLSEP